MYVCMGMYRTTYFRPKVAPILCATVQYYVLYCSTTCCTVCVVLPLYDCMVVCLYDCKSVRLYGCKIVRLYDCMPYNHTAIRTAIQQAFMFVRLHGCEAVWLYGCMIVSLYVWVFECTAVCVYAMYVFMYGYMNVRMYMYRNYLLSAEGGTYTYCAVLYVVHYMLY